MGPGSPCSLISSIQQVNCAPMDLRAFLASRIKNAFAFGSIRKLLGGGVGCLARGRPRLDIAICPAYIYLLDLSGSTKNVKCALVLPYFCRLESALVEGGLGNGHLKSRANRRLKLLSLSMASGFHSNRFLSTIKILAPQRLKTFVMKGAEIYLQLAFGRLNFGNCACCAAPRRWC